jgi:hypothetical protein
MSIHQLQGIQILAKAPKKNPRHFFLNSSLSPLKKQYSRKPNMDEQLDRNQRGTNPFIAQA